MILCRFTSFSFVELEGQDIRFAGYTILASKAKEACLTQSAIQLASRLGDVENASGLTQ